MEEIGKKSLARFHFPCKFPVEDNFYVPREYDCSDKVRKPKLRLHTYQYDSEIQPPKGIILIQHGYCDYIGSYLQIAHKFSLAGYTVVGFDHRGFGQSEGEDILIEDFAIMVKDTMFYYEEMVKPQLGSLIPVYMYGHSMGGLVGCLTAALHPLPWAGLILLAPAWAPPPGNYPDWGIKFWVKVFGPILKPLKKLPLYDFSLNKISNDPEIIYWLKNDPLKRLSKMKIGTQMAFAKGMLRAKECLERIKSPLLLIQGGKDQVVDVKRVLDSFCKLIIKNKELYYIPEGWHDVNINKETEDMVNKKIIDWLDEQIEELTLR